MTLQDILSRLNNVKKFNGYFMARCPSHPDKQNSLKIREGSKRVFLDCLAQCDESNIISTLDLEMKDLFSASNGFHKQDFKQKSAARRIVETYDYTDENGNLLFQAVRYEPKGFAQRQPDGKGGFVWNLQNTRLVLYRLPEVLTSPVVYFVEGEKDVETLCKNDLPATCNPMGAGKWRESYNEFLRDKTIIILPDNDEAGRKHAEAVATSLYGIAKEIVIVELPNLKPKGDVTDYFNDGGTVDALIDLAGRAEAFEPSKHETEETVSDAADDADFQSLLIVQSANAWIEEAKLKPIQKMIFDEFWLEGEVCIFFGDTGKNKTTLAVQIADSVSSGANIAGFKLEAEKQIILYLDCELSDKQFERRYAVREGDKYVNHYIFDEYFQRVEINRYRDIPKRFAGDFERYLFYSLEYEIARTGSRILIVDNITYLKNATETAKDALPLMKELIRLKMKYDLSIKALAHTPKRDLSRPITVNDLQGSKMLSNFSDNIFAIGESAKDKNLRYLKQIKPRSGELVFDAENVAVCQLVKPNNFLRLEFLNYGSEFEHLKQMTETDKKDLIEKVKNLHDLGESQRKISKDLGIPLTSVNRYVNLDK